MVISAILCSFEMTGTRACFWPLSGRGLAIHTTRAAAFSAERVFNLQKAASERNRVASGEYRIVAETNEGGIGPFAPGIHNFRESWTIWRASDSGLEVEGERDYESPNGKLHTDKFYIRMSSAFRILGVREFKKLRWRPDCGVHPNVLPRLCPSLPGLRSRSPSLVRLVHRYCSTVRLLQHVHVRRAAFGLRGPALFIRPRRAGDLPVLVHVVSQRARVLRLRRTDSPLAISVAAVLPSSYSE